MVGLPYCADKSFRPVYSFDLSNNASPGDYAIWISDPSTSLGKYYQMHFDGSNWSAISPVLNPILSNNDTITSTVYTVSQLTGGAGTISNVASGTAKADFESALSKNDANQVWDDSKIENPVVSGDTLTVTAQDGKTIAIYTVNVISPSITQLKITSSSQIIAVNNPSGVFTVESQDSGGNSAKVLSATHVSLSSSSSTGTFSWASAGGSCDSDWTKTSVTIATGTANRSFCYQDSTPGTYTITVSSAGLSSDSQTVIVTP